MTDENKPAKPTKAFQLLHGGMQVEGTEYVAGDTVHIDPKHGERLQNEGHVGPVGTLEKRAKAREDAARIMAEAERSIREAEDDDVPDGIVPAMPAGVSSAARMPGESATPAVQADSAEPAGRRTIRRGDS